jgi:hypothetical protein
MKISKTAVALSVVALSVVGQAAAASQAETAITAIGTEISALATAAWPIVIALVMAFTGMKLFKKFANKAS